jgi:hypothetical protein
MKSIVPLLVTLATVLSALAVAPAVAEVEPAYTTTHAPVVLSSARDMIYCQQPLTWNAVNASSGYGSELSDDIPGYAGRYVRQVRFYVAEWGAGWREPLGLQIDFYYATCPPPMQIDVLFRFEWSDLLTSCVYAGSWYVYEVTADLPTPVLILPHTSIGGFVINDWQHDPPYCGLVVKDFPAGCDVAYWDCAYWGMPRWSPLTDGLGIYWDLAFCIGEEEPTVTQTTSWGRIRSLFR